MPNANIDLPYNVPKNVKVRGFNAADTFERPVTNILVQSKSSSSISVVATGDPQVWTVKNLSQTATGSGSITWQATNELSQNITGITPLTLIPADPATHLVTTEQ